MEYDLETLKNLEEAYKRFASRVTDLDKDELKMMESINKQIIAIKKQIEASFKNDGSEKLHKDALNADFSNSEWIYKYGHQKELRECNKKIRIIKKSRNIGVSFYFAFEALENAINTDRDQIMISRSMKQISNLHKYIKEFATKTLKIKLGFNSTFSSFEIHKSEGRNTSIYFLSTWDPDSLDGFHGNVYVDEFLHMENFEKAYSENINQIPEDNDRITLFSSVGSRNHYGLKLYDKLINEDSATCFEYTIHDAIKLGYDRISVDKAKIKSGSLKAFEHAYLCVPSANEGSAFSLTAIDKCYEKQKEIFSPFDPLVTIQPGISSGASINSFCLCIFLVKGENYQLYKYKEYDDMLIDDVAKDIRETLSFYTNTNNTEAGFFEQFNKYHSHKLLSDESFVGLKNKKHFKKDILNKIIERKIGIIGIDNNVPCIKLSELIDLPCNIIYKETREELDRILVEADTLMRKGLIYLEYTGINDNKSIEETEEVNLMIRDSIIDIERSRVSERKDDETEEFVKIRTIADRTILNCISINLEEKDPSIFYESESFSMLNHTAYNKDLMLKINSEETDNILTLQKKLIISTDFTA